MPWNPSNSYIEKLSQIFLEDNRSGFTFQINVISTSWYNTGTWKWTLLLFLWPFWNMFSSIDSVFISHFFPSRNITVFVLRYLGTATIVFLDSLNPARTMLIVVSKWALAWSKPSGNLAFPFKYLGWAFTVQNKRNILQLSFGEKIMCLLEDLDNSTTISCRIIFPYKPVCCSFTSNYYSLPIIWAKNLSYHHSMWIKQETRWT